ncbi:YfgM family protein [Piscirickettsia salmonis]|uniref:YfgM family protein n=1 Tax=Piscirickettsia salmonis TaxID=1238 RepID=UPI0007C8FCC4|nr:Tetratricopeptide repeat protein [Piscirickettsiaceae bacterium NZ-RLO1]
MDAQLDTQQSDRTQKITKQIVGVIAVIVIIALAVAGGWQYSVYRGNNYKAEASTQYERLLKQIAENKPTEALAVATALRNQYTKTPYAILASLFMSKAYIAKKELPKAQAALEWALKENKTTALAGLITIRLARVLIAQQQYQSAIDLLTPLLSKDQKEGEGAKYLASANAYQGMYHYVLAEAYQASGNSQQAKSDFQKAEKLLANDASALQSVVQMKVNNLPMQTETKAGTRIESAAHAKK